MPPLMAVVTHDACHETAGRLPVQSRSASSWAVRLPSREFHHCAGGF